MLPHLCTNADKGEKSMRRNVPATKCPCDEMSMQRNVPATKCPRRNVRDEVSVRRSVRHSIDTGMVVRYFQRA